MKNSILNMTNWEIKDNDSSIFQNKIKLMLGVGIGQAGLQGPTAWPI